MNRIYLSLDIIHYSLDYAKAYCLANPNMIKNLKELYNKLQVHSGLSATEITPYLNYINHIIDDYGTGGNLLFIKPSEIEQIIKDYDRILTEDQLNKELIFGVTSNGKIKKKKFNKLISNLFHYSDIARQLLIPYIEAMGIRTCVYCNIQFALTVNNNIGYYQMDHRLPQSKYPFLSASFFNLQPCCADCNREKSNEISNFILYGEDYNALQPFHLLVSSSGYFKRRNLKRDEITIDLIPSDVKSNSDIKLCMQHERLFNISAKYSMLKDVAEETIWRCKAYDRTYSEIFLKKFPELYDKDSLHRFIFGVYSSKDEIHTRPLSKLILDIEQDLKVVL